jgi:sugar (pentulose or hexulose) kinase
MGKKAAFAGIDLGTTGIRIIVADEGGGIVSTSTANILASTVQSDDPGASEQDPCVWREALFSLLQRGLDLDGDHELMAVAVDSTSGTIIPVDEGGAPLYNALMHNDIRAQEEAGSILAETGMSVKPSFALPKILWMKRHRPAVFERASRFIHAADYIRGLITGDFQITDFSNAVKTGYDLENMCWPPSIESVLHIPLEKLPGVVKTGEVCGTLLPRFCEELTGGKSVSVVAGATDSTTSFYSSGAEHIGDWNTTVGTVLGIRGIAPEFIVDPEGLLYAHRHPEGFWLPGAASNTGGEAVRMYFGDRLEEYDELIQDTPPTGSLIYPLARKSEKFPFLNMNAVGFIDCTIDTPPMLFKGFLEGVAFVERMIYERIERIGYHVGDAVFSMGGGAYSDPWLHIRADILDRKICRAREVEAAFGAAIIAASGVHFSSLSEAIRHMVSIDTIVEPQPEQVGVYEDVYGRFLEKCRQRGLFP